MAQKVHVVLVDDIDGSDATETVAFGLDGTSYEIDLNDANATKLRDALAPFLGHARKVTTGSRRGAVRRASGAGANGSGPSAKEIRDWARENGYDVPERGRVSAEVREAYAAAH